MPFPLAHPAAVLPLRRIRHLNVPALLIGAVIPDLSYCLERYDIDAFAHTVRGCFGFSLPVGWLAVLIFQAVRDPLVQRLPDPHRRTLMQSIRKPDGFWFAVPLSVLIGAASHVFWDAFTHETGWFVERSSFLQMALLTMDGHRFRMYRLLWHLSTWAGLFFLCRAYVQAIKRRTGSAQVFLAGEGRRYALWAAIFSAPLLGVLPFLIWRIEGKGLSPVETLRTIKYSAAAYLVATSLLLIAIGAVLKIRDRPGA